MTYTPARLAPSYIIYVDGSVFRAVNGQTGLVVASNADAAAVLTAVLPAANSTGAQITFSAGTYTWSSVPALPKGITGKLSIEGSAGTIIQLSSSGPRFLDFNRTADYDTFQNLEINNITIDNNNIGGRHHVVLGSYISGSSTVTQRCNFSKITIRRVRTINVPSDSTTTNHRLNVWISCYQVATGEATQNTLTDILVEECRFEGGNEGVFIGGTNGGGSGTAPGTNIFCNRIFVRKNYHTLGSFVGAAFSSSNYQIGSYAQVGHCEVEGNYGAFSGDVGIEIDNAENCLCSRNLIDDCAGTAFYQTNFNNVPGGPQRIVWDQCIGRRTTVTTGIFTRYQYSNSIPLGDILYNNCRWYVNGNDVGASADSIFNSTVGTVLKSLTVTNFRGVIENIIHTTGATGPVLFNINATGPGSTSTEIKMRDIYLSLAGTLSGGTITLTMVGLNSGNLAVDITGVRAELNVSGIGNFQRIFDIGGNTSTIRGNIRGVSFGPTWTPDTGPRGFIIRGTATLTIGSLLIEDCDFSLAPSGVTEILFTTPPQNMDKVFFSNNVWRTVPINGYHSVSANYTALYPQDTDGIILMDASAAARTVTLPSAIGMPPGTTYTIKRINSGVNAVTVATTSSQTIDGATTYVLGSQYETLAVISDGANWQIMNDDSQTFSLKTKTTAYSVLPTDDEILVDPSSASFALTLEDAVANAGAVHRIGIAPAASVLDTANLVSFLTQTGQTIEDYNLPAPVQAALAQTASAGQLNAGTYYYVVTAVNDVGETLASNERSITVAASLLAPPVAISAVTASTGGSLPDALNYSYVVTALSAAGETISSNVVSTGTLASGTATNSNVVTWNTVTGATSYKVYRFTSNGLGCQVFSPGNVLTFTDTLTWSSARLGNAPDLNLTGASITVTWAAVPGARYYHVYRGTSASGENTRYSAFGITSFIDTGLIGELFIPPTLNTTLLTLGTPRSGAPFSDVTLIADGANWRLI